MLFIQRSSEVSFMFNRTLAVSEGRVNALEHCDRAWCAYRCCVPLSFPHPSNMCVFFIDALHKYIPQESTCFCLSFFATLRQFWL
ncbi:unnamed protein product [Phytomonas sp. EM1]|nr:unnamed protein product [Phytomonas sp. EM1]|eukprot:CCW62043.1 unnamed protein product [Phytomonas sp. isolate EM1]